MTIASPSNASTTCGAGAFIDAPAGGSTITLTGGVLVEGPVAAAVLEPSVLVIPTASEWGLLLLASLLAAGAVWRLRG